MFTHRVYAEFEEEMSMERGIIYNFNSEGNVEAKYVFSGFQANSTIEEEQNVKILPKGMYLTLAYSKENEEERRRKIVKYVKENQLEITSFIEVELFNDFFNTNSYSCQIQMFIENNESVDCNR